MRGPGSDLLADTSLVSFTFADQLALLIGYFLALPLVVFGLALLIVAQAFRLVGNLRCEIGTFLLNACEIFRCSLCITQLGLERRCSRCTAWGFVGTVELAEQISLLLRLSCIMLAQIGDLPGQPVDLTGMLAGHWPARCGISGKS